MSPSSVDRDATRKARHDEVCRFPETGGTRPRLRTPRASGGPRASESPGFPDFQTNSSRTIRPVFGTSVIGLSFAVYSFHGSTPKACQKLA